jgi:cytochrome c-type biogenesis protein CcmH
MVTFVVLVAVLTMAGVVAVAIPLMRPNAAGAAPALWAALGAAAVLMIGSAALYVTWSNWPWHASEAADSPQSMVARLARRLEHEPNDLNGWLMLGRSYTVLQEYPLAVRAYERADRLSGGRSAEALTGEAEALAMGDESELDGRAARLIEQALALAPDSGKALFYGAVIAERHGDLRLARERFARLLALNPPDNVRPVLEQQISTIDQKLAGATVSAAAPQSADTPSASADAVVRVSVTVAPSLAASSTGGAPLFVFVRKPGEAGPPLAVKRLDSHFPQDVALTPSDSMVPGRAFAAGQSVQVVARIARSGSPVAASGDPFGEVSYQVGRDGLVSLVIDRLTP